MIFATCSGVQIKWIDPLIASELMPETFPADALSAFQIQLWNIETVTVIIACIVTAALWNDSATVAAQVEVEVFG